MKLYPTTRHAYFLFYPGPVKVSLDRIEVEREGTGYRVLLDNRPIGHVYARKVLSSKTYKGGKVRYDLGHPTRWFVRGKHLAFDTRIEAIKSLVEGEVG